MLTQSCLFSGREPFTEAITYATANLGDEGLLAALHAYHQWEKEELFTVQEITCLNSQRAFQHIKMVEWKDALKSTDAYERITEEMRDHVPWGAREQMAIGQVIPHLKKCTYMHWEEDAKGLKTSWEVKDHPQKQKKCAKCCKAGHFAATVPSELLTSKDSEQGMVTWWTIRMLLLTDFLTIYIHFSHTLAGVVTTSLTVLYLPSNPLQPHSVACMSFQIITRILTLIC